MPLSDEAARQLLATHERSGSLKVAELEQIVRGAEGNPLYLEELLNAFLDNTDFLRGLTWAPTVTQARILTPALESLLLARIDRLPPEARKLAQTAALIGRSFRLRVLEHVAESQDLEGDLAILLRADIIRELRRYPGPGVHVQARAAAPCVPLDAAARPPPRALRRGRRGHRDALRRFARRQPRGAGALLLAQPRPAEGARVPRARRRRRRRSSTRSRRPASCSAAR